MYSWEVFKVWGPLGTPELSQRLFYTEDIWGSTNVEKSLLRAFLIWLKGATSGKWGYCKSPLLGSFMALKKMERPLIL